jgi:uncharacterized protein YbaR (Trm112 family)
MSFRIAGLPAAPFAELFALPDEALARRRARRVVADRPHAYPCRVSLTDAEPGQEVILLHYEHHPVDTPFRASHAIYVREGERWYEAVDEVPGMLRRRLLSVRGYDAEGMLRDAEVVEGAALEAVMERMLAQSRIDYLHLHFARPGCYAARVERA